MQKATAVHEVTAERSEHAFGLAQLRHYLNKTGQGFDKAKG